MARWVFRSRGCRPARGRRLLAEVAGLGGDQAERPLLELEVVVLVVAPAPGEVAGAGEVLRHAVGVEGDAGEGVAQALLDQADGEVGDVDADPLPPELLRRVHGGAAAAERVEHHLAGV